MVFISEMGLLLLAVCGGTGGLAGALDYRHSRLAWVEGYRTVSTTTVPQTLSPHTPASAWGEHKGKLPSHLPRGPQRSLHSLQIYARHLSLAF